MMFVLSLHIFVRKPGFLHGRALLFVVNNVVV